MVLNEERCLRAFLDDHGMFGRTAGRRLAPGTLTRLIHNIRCLSDLRLDLVLSVRARIRGGFYDADAVIDRILPELFQDVAAWEEPS